MQDKLKKWLCRWFVIKKPVAIQDCHRRNNMKEKKVSLFLFAAFADEIGRAEAPSDMQFRHCIFYLKTSGKCWNN
ncbi:MAG: hypothetical protein J6P83_06220 [Bacteroidales bacterium]|nr:hypothetical protein [Bacteroidales bacterium]